MLKSILLPFLIIIVLFSCKDDAPESPLKGCCGNEAIDEDVGNGHVYVPNIFSPNGDGINDILFVNTDSVQLLVEFEIRDKTGKLIFETFDAMPNEPLDGWDGKVDGLVVEGLYSILVSITAEDGTNQILMGKVCNYPCDDAVNLESISFENCQFTLQVNNGYFDPTKPNGESADCLE